MRQPLIHMSTGAWIFATGVAVSIIASTGVYATANSIFAIGNSSGSTTAYVTPTRQLQTVTTAPTNIVRFDAGAGNGYCIAAYTPPAGKAIVVTQVTYEFGDSIQGHQSSGTLTNAACTTGYDQVQSDAAYGSESHTFPTGQPMAGVGIENSVGNELISVIGRGYLIPASQLPADDSGSLVPMKGMHRGG